MKARRPNANVISGLVRKYARMLGRLRVADTATESDAMWTEMAHMEAVIRIFDPSIDPWNIRPVRHSRSGRSRYLRDAITILRQVGEPMSARDLARCILADRGIRFIRPALEAIACPLHQGLGRMEGLGLVRLSRTPRRWMMDSEP